MEVQKAGGYKRKGALIKTEEKTRRSESGRDGQEQHGRITRLESLRNPKYFIRSPSSSTITATLTFLSCTIIAPEITIAVIRCVIASGDSPPPPFSSRLALIIISIIWIIIATSVTHFQAYLAFARVTFQELVGLKLLLLVGHHPRHLEQEPRLGGRLWLLGGRLRGVVVGGRVGEHVSWVRRLWVLGRVPEREHVERLGGCTVQHRGGLRHLHHSRY